MKLLACALLLLCQPAHAADAAPASRPTEVFSHGVTVFEAQRELAPRASLRFRVLRGAAGERTLWLQNPGGRSALQLAPDSTFNPTALSAGQGMVEAPAGLAVPPAWRPDIRSPGLPPGSRRLGDLRLECLVDLQSGLNPQGDPASCLPPDRKAGCLDEMSACLHSASLALLAELHQFRQLQLGKTPYPAPPFHYLFIADKPVLSIQLAHGERRLTLPPVWLHGGAAAGPSPAWPYPRAYLYSLPLDSADWPDDTLVIFEHAVKS